jgi:hypothetical protein
VSSIYDTRREVRWNSIDRALEYLGANGKTWTPIPTEDTVTLFDADGNPVTVRLVNGEYALVSADERTHRGLERIELLLGAILDELRGTAEETKHADSEENEP